MKKDETRRDSAARAAAPEEGASIVAVSALMDERRRFESWIAALEARKHLTPEHVFARVHADYAARLEAVLGQLTAHADGLRHEMESLIVRLGGLSEERQKAQDERAEAELRAHVGELSPEEWERTAGASDARLADLAQRHGHIDEELARTRELLRDAERPVPPAPVEAAVPADIAPRVSAAIPAPGEPASAAVSEVTDAEQHVPIAAAEAAPAIVPPAALPPAPGTGTPTRASRFDELAFLSSVVDTPSGAMESGPKDRGDETARRDSFASRATEEPIMNLSERRKTPLDALAVELEREQNTPLAANVSGNVPIVLRDKLDGAKTLKCGECGAMNYPTEWYCERCGAELASL